MSSPRPSTPPCITSGGSLGEAAVLSRSPRTAAHPSNRMRAFGTVLMEHDYAILDNLRGPPNLPIHAPVKECPDRAFHSSAHCSSHRSAKRSSFTFFELPPEFGDATRDFKTGTGAGGGDPGFRPAQPPRNLPPSLPLSRGSLPPLSLILAGESPCASLDSAITP